MLKSDGFDPSEIAMGL